MGDAAIISAVFLETIGYWWVIIPTIFLGLIVGGIPGFSAANTIIILMPLTLAMDLQMGLVFMVSLYCESRSAALADSIARPARPTMARASAGSREQ